MLTLLTTFTSIAIAVPAPHYLQSEDAKRLQHDKEAPSLYNNHQAEGADKFSPLGNGSAAASKHEIALVAPVDVGYDPCFEGQDVCKKWCAKNTKSWPQKCTFSKYCAGCTQCASVDDEQAFCLTVTAPWATKCNWEKCHGHIQCSDGTVPCESPTSSPSIPPSAPPSAPPPSAPPSCTFTQVTLGDALASCKQEQSSEACYIATVGCAPNAWDVSAVKSLAGSMFYSAWSFNQDVADWDVSAVTNMNKAFYGTSKFNQDLADWDVSAVKEMGGMFYLATSFNQDIADWDVSAVTSMWMMFYQAKSFNQDFADWDVSAVTSTYSMFGYLKSFNQRLADWDVSAVNNMASMFYYASSFNQDLADWDVSAVSSMNKMFKNSPMFCNSVPTKLQTDTSCTPSAPPPSAPPKSCVFNPKFEITSSDGTIAEASLKDAIARCADDDYSEACYIANVGCAPNAWDVSAVKSMQLSFSEATSFNQGLADWDVSAVTDMLAMFNKVTSFNQGLADWDVSAVKDMRGIFTGATSFNQGLADWDVSAATDIGAMFYETSFNQDIADWDVSAATDMGFMFYKAPSFNQGLADWDVSAVKNMQSSFYEATSFNQDLADWDVAAVENMQNMFKYSPMSCNLVPTKFQTGTTECTA